MLGGGDRDTLQAPETGPPAAEVRGEDDNDRVFGGSFTIGGAGNDSVTGTRVRGNSGNDSLFGLNGEPGKVQLAGGSGNDRLHDADASGRPEADTYIGGTGSDTVLYTYFQWAARAAPLAIRLDNAQNDGADPNRDGKSTQLEEGDQLLDIEHAVGGKGPDYMVGNSAYNFLQGGPGDDRLHGRDGASVRDYLHCGDGFNDRARGDAVDYFHPTCEFRF